MNNYLRLGIIGMSEGNGHPYSWSAIFNGYDVDAIEQCGFPVIPRYLEKQEFPETRIAQAKVTHVWTQDQSLSKQIAKTCFIDNIVDYPTQMIGKVDGILLARDDAENHYDLAKPFLDASIPIYIDKPLALSVTEAIKIFKSQKFPGQVFTCSALKYANELKLSSSERLSLGKINNINAQVPKDWNRYSIHIIEPLLNIVQPQNFIVNYRVYHQGDSTTLKISWSSGITSTISATGKMEGLIFLAIETSHTTKNLIFSDTFSCFKAALNDFVQGIINQDIRTDSKFVLDSIKIVELGRVK